MKTIIRLFPASLNLWEWSPPLRSHRRHWGCSFLVLMPAKTGTKNLFMRTWESHWMVIWNILWRVLLYVGSYWVSQIGIWHILGPRWMSNMWLYRSSDFCESCEKLISSLSHVFSSPKTSYRWASDAFLSASVNFCTAVTVVCQAEWLLFMSLVFLKC